MIKQLIFSFISGALIMETANATICRLIPTTCYNDMGNGYLYDTTDPTSWDITSGCWGKKMICLDALTTEYISAHNTNDSVALGRKEIANATKSDFDTTILDGDCFGARKTKNDGAMVSVNGRYVNVWCSGVLDDLNIRVNETIDNGDITLDVQPTCDSLAMYGYINTQNGKCFGKYYNQNEYYIMCNGNTPTLVVLNGADYNNISNSNIRTMPQATTLFNTMYENARAQHRIYFQK